MIVYEDISSGQAEKAQQQIISYLKREGYPTYASMFSEFKLYLTEDPKFVGAMRVDKAEIFLNVNLSLPQASMVVRHEILHEWLTHGKRHDDFHTAYPEYKANHELSNVAADFEISNKGYTDEDKLLAKESDFYGRKLSGLVTEIDKPGWENLTFEEMYKKLLDEKNENEKELEKILEQLSQLSNDELNEIMDKLEELDNESSNSTQSNSTQTDSDKSTTQSNSDKISSGDDNSSENSDDKQDSSTSSDNVSDKQFPNEDENNISKEIDELKSEVENISEEEDKINNSKNGELDTESEQKKKLDLAEKVKKIKDKLNDSKLLDKALGETSDNQQKYLDKIAASKEAEKIRTSPLHKFKLQLNNFIENQVEYFDGSSWSRLNKSYDGTGIYKPGRTSMQSHKIPEVNVYYDVSSSFADEVKTEGAKQALTVLNKYVREKKLKINTRFFASRLGQERSGLGIGTNPDLVIEHIIETKPLNVIIITDSDFATARKNVTVPGGVFLVYYDTDNSTIINNILSKVNGKQKTSYFVVEGE